jgi:hypothetical protein
MEHPGNAKGEYLTKEGYKRLQSFALEERFVCFYFDKGRVCADTEMRGNGDTVTFDREGQAIDAAQSEDTIVF